MVVGFFFLCVCGGGGGLLWFLWGGGGYCLSRHFLCKTWCIKNLNWGGGGG